MKFFTYYPYSFWLSITAKSQDRNPVLRLKHNVPKSSSSIPTQRLIISILNFRNHTINLTLSIFQFAWKKVFEVTNVSPKTIVNLSDFLRGVYIFQLRDKSGKVVDSGKFQVSK